MAPALQAGLEHMIYDDYKTIYERIEMVYKKKLK